MAHHGVTEVDTEKVWLATYIYYAEPWESILLKAVAPLVDWVMRGKLADRFFYIRYWERGPHIRLRFFGDPTIMEEKIKPEMTARLEKYMAEHPSELPHYDWMDNLSDDQKWYPNNTLQEIPYEPEVERYGGPVGIVIAERQFEASSRATLAAFAESEQWDYERALGVGIQMHLAFAYALGMSLKELQAFCEIVARAWLPRAYGFRPDMSQEEHQQKGDEIRGVFAETFAQQKEILLPFCQTLWGALEEEVVFEQEWLNDWVRDMKIISADLNAAADMDELVFPRQYFRSSDPSIPERRQQLWTIFESYVHMTNNRLGILNRDEAFLGYLIKETVDLF